MKRLKQLKKLSAWVFLLTLCFHLVSSLIPIRELIIASNLQDDDVVQVASPYDMENYSESWHVTVNPSGKVPSDQTLSIQLDQKFEHVDSITRAKDDQPNQSVALRLREREDIYVTTDKKEYDQRWKDYQTYRQELHDYQERLQEYEESYAKYQKELAAYEQQISEQTNQQQPEIAPSVESHDEASQTQENESSEAENSNEVNQTSNDETNQTQGNEETIQKESNETSPTQNIDKPVPPTEIGPSPENVEKEKLWQIIYQPNENETYYEWRVPKEAGAQEFDWLTSLTSFDPAEFKTTVTSEWLDENQVPQKVKRVVPVELKDMAVGARAFASPRPVVAGQQTGKFTLTKKDNKDPSKLLEGAEFTLYSEKKNEAGEMVPGEAIMTLTTNENGKVTFNEVPPGEYFLRETKAPAGYWLDENEKPVNVKVFDSGLTIFPKKRGPGENIDNQETKLSVDSYSFIVDDPDSPDVLMANDGKFYKMESVLKVTPKIKPGDHFTIQFDPKLKPEGTESSFRVPELKDGAGNLLAIGTYDYEQKKITYVFGEKVDGIPPEGQKINIVFNVSPDRERVLTSTDSLSLTNTIAGFEQMTTTKVDYTIDQFEYLRGFITKVDFDNKMVEYTIQFKDKPNIPRLWYLDINPMDSDVIIGPNTEVLGYKVFRDQTTGIGLSESFADPATLNNVHDFRELENLSLVEKRNGSTRIKFLYRTRWNFRNVLRDDNPNYEGFIIKIRTPFRAVEEPNLKFYAELVAEGGKGIWWSGIDNFHVKRDSTVDVEGTPIEAEREIFNQKLAEFTFEKVKETDTGLEALSGAVFELTSDATDDDGTPIYQETLGDDENNPLSTFTFKNLQAGTYRLKELKAPTGYVLPDREWKLNVELDQETKEYTVQLEKDQAFKDFIVDPTEAHPYRIKNYNPPEFPKTGGSGSLIYLMSGLTLMFIALNYQYQRNRTRH